MTLEDGNDIIKHCVPQVVELIAETARWVDPATFKLLPVWRPESARQQPLYDAQWERRLTNTVRATGITAKKLEGNVAAQKVLLSALGVRKPTNWTVCHIWGYDDLSFVQPGSIVRDPRYFSCIANMVLLPTALKSFSDSMPQIKRILRTCAFHLYGWTCEHDSVREQAKSIRRGVIPEFYPNTWPTSDRLTRPKGVCPLTASIESAARLRLHDLSQKLNSVDQYPHFPRQQVRNVLGHWRIRLPQR